MSLLAKTIFAFAFSQTREILVARFGKFAFSIMRRP